MEHGILDDVLETQGFHGFLVLCTGDVSFGKEVLQVLLQARHITAAVGDDVAAPVEKQGGVEYMFRCDLFMRPGFGFVERSG
mgnify:CR=1 FL=1